MESVATLIAQLNSDDANVAEDAQRALQALGREAIAPVLTAVGNLRLFGQRCALDLLERSPVEMLRQQTEPSVAHAVMPLLTSDDAVVREWAANVLRRGDARESIPLLRAALDRAKRARIPIDWTESVALRQALTALGDRHEIIPRLLTTTMICHPTLQRCWPATRITDVVTALAEERQVLLDLQAWRLTNEGALLIKVPRWEVQLSGSWDEVVERSKRMALGAMVGWIAPRDTVVTLEWIAESDI